MARPQSTKVRAKRIALSYFKQPHPFRRWKFILSVAVPVVAGLWLLVYVVQGNQRVYNSGPVSTAHAMFEKDCVLCHGPGPAESAPATLTAAPSGYWLNVSDRACQTCHAGPRHQAQETFTPRCAACHVEHRGRAQLVQIADRHCTQCHADLRTKDDRAPAFHRTIPTLAQHPEFAVTVRDGHGQARRVRLDDKAGVHDAAQVKLNHAKHLKANLKGLEDLQKKSGMAGLIKVKDGVQLSCTFCHQPDERGQYMKDVAYAKHCAACHPLDFDARFPDVVVPHDAPRIVHAFLRGTLSEAFDQCQAIPAGEAGKALRDRCVELELAKPVAQPAAEGERPRGLGRARGVEAEPPPSDEPRGGRLRGRPAEPEPAPAPDTPRGGRLRGRATEEETPPADSPRGGRLRRGGDEAAAETPRGRPGRGGEAAPGPASWVSSQLEATEPGLFKQRCEYCHTVARASGPVPDVAPTAIPSRWLPHARFDHGVHRPLGCAECHKAAASSETKDVLLPMVAACRECHQPRAGARSGCVECHRYHDRTQDRDLDGPFKVRQLLNGTSSPRSDRLR